MPPPETKQNTTDSKSSKKGLLDPSRFSRNQLITIAVIFAAIGGYVLYRSFASVYLVTSLQAEQMTLPASQWDYAYADSTASGGKAVALLSGGTLTGTVSFPSSVTSLTVVAKGDQCNGAPTMIVKVDGTTILNSQAVTSTSWADYSANVSLATGSHTLSIRFNNDYYNNSCDRNLYVDVTNFYGPVVSTASLVTSLQAENMTLPPSKYASIYSDSTASGGKAVALDEGGSLGTLTGTVSFPSSVTSLTVVAKGDQCSGAPTMNVVLDSTTVMNQLPVSATGWTSYSATLANAASSGSHSLSIAFTNDYNNSSCDRNLYVDVTNFYGSGIVPASPAPTVSISPSPASVTAGSASTLTWSSANASSCTASGAWSGSQPTSGSSSTGALNQNSTYTLTCTGSGGSASASATISVSAAASGGGGGSASGPTGGVWSWNAATATLDPNSASKISAFQSYAVGAGVYFQAHTAWINAPAGTPAYSIPMVESFPAVTVPIPLGTKPGNTNDGELTVLDLSTGINYDFGNATYNSTSGKITGAFGIGAVQPGSLWESPGSASAAAMSVRPLLIFPSDIASGVIAHPLAFSIPAGPGGGVTATPVYPARSGVSPEPGSGLPLGTWLRLDPTINVPSLGLNAFETMILVALQKYGMFNRDAGSTLTIYGTDQVNQGGNAADWGAVGVSLPLTNNGIGYASQFSSGFVAQMAHLQVLLPPSH